MLRLFVTLFVFLIIPFYPVYSQGGSIPAGLPNTFGFGAIDKADSWASYGPHFYKGDQGTTCWDYSYQYLTPGWVGWVAGGAWASNELTYWEARGQIQVFTVYYQPYNLAYYQDATNMTNYFNDFKTLCQRAANYSTKKVIIHIEPDLIGFWRQGGRTATQAGVVQVGGSNFDETCDGVSINGLANTIRGWSEALYRIRNQYAGGKVLLAHHYTHWATGADIFTGTQDQATCNTHVDDMTGYISGIENGLAYDLFFVDPSDRDADWWRINGGGGNTRWTGPTRTYTNDRNWGKIAYITNRISNNLSRRGMFWQIPVGNTYYKTCNNSANHYRDNSAQEFIPSTSANGSSGTPGDAYSSSSTTTGPGYWAQNGIIAVLFGEGGYDGYVTPSNMTHLRDWPTDNTTNPATDANAGGPAYNVWGQATSSVADNDGGYVRNAVARYCLTGKYVIGGPAASPTFTRTATPTRTSTQVVPPTFTFTRTVTVTPVNTATYTATGTATGSRTVTQTWTMTRTPTFTRTETPPANTYTNTPQVSATNTPAATFTNTPQNTWTATAVNTATNTRVPTGTFTVTNTPVVTATNTPYGTLTITPTVTRTGTPQLTMTFTRTQTLQPSATASRTATPIASATYTATVYASPTITPTAWNNPSVELKFLSGPAVFPNPATAGTAFSVALSVSKYADKVNLKIYTGAMRLVRLVKITGGMTVADDRITVAGDNTKGLSRGVYYCVVTAASGNSSEIRTKPFPLLLLNN